MSARSTFSETPAYTTRFGSKQEVLAEEALVYEGARSLFESLLCLEERALGTTDPKLSVAAHMLTDLLMLAPCYWCCLSVAMQI